MLEVDLAIPAGLSHRRRIGPEDKLRLSLTDACNYSCSFCHNEGNLPALLSSARMPSPREALFYLECALLAGIRKVKLTGGEPLTYKFGSVSFANLVELLHEAVGSCIELSATTNGQLLPTVLKQLSPAHLSHLTLSIHTLDHGVFRSVISDSGSPLAQIKGLRMAAELGFKVKVNTVVLPNTVQEVPTICKVAFQSGASTVRLYRQLWSPLGETNFRRVGDQQLVDLATHVTGLPMTDEITAYALGFLGGQIAVDEGPLLITGANGEVELDRMPPQTMPSQDEGAYALRISPEGELRSHLYAEPVPLSQFSKNADHAGALERFATARLNLAERRLNG